MSDLERILNLAGLGNQNVAEETGEKKMVCKDCGDEFGHPTSDCENSAYDKDGDHWIEIDVDGDGEADIKVADRGMKGDMEEAVGDSAEAFYDMQDQFAGGEAEGAHKVIIDELVRYLSGDQLEDFVADFSRHYDMGVEEAELDEDDLDENAFNQAAAAAARAGKSEFEFNGKTYKTKMDKSTAHQLDDDVQFDEGRMSDQIIGDSETMSKEEFAKKYGKEMADEYYESVQESSCGCCGNDPCDCADDCGCKESVNEAPTMDTTQLVTMLRNAGLTEEAIEAKLNEWANTPNGVGETEPTEHGEAYDFAQSVNLSLKKYLDAESMKVQVSESYTAEGLKEAYKSSKKK